MSPELLESIASLLFRVEADAHRATLTPLYLVRLRSESRIQLQRNFFVYHTRFGRDDDNI